MLSLFTTTNVVSLAVQIPVSGIEIVGNNIVYLDLDKNEKYHVEYTVYPTNAKNQKVVFFTEQIGNSPLATLTYQDGYIMPHTTGMAKVYLKTVDGGFQDSFVVQVDSEYLQAIECDISRSEIYVGESATITTSFTPSNASDTVLQYVSSDESVVRVNEKGVVTGVKRGTATITVKAMKKPTVYDTVDVTVSNRDIMDIEYAEIKTYKASGTLNLSMDTQEAYELSYAAYDENEEALTQEEFSVAFDFSEQALGKIVLNYTFLSDVKSVRLEITAKTEFETVTEICRIERMEEISVSFDEESTLVFNQGQNGVVHFTLSPADADVNYNVFSSDESVAKVSLLSGLIVVEAGYPGVATVTLEVENNESGHVESLQKEIVVKPKAFMIEETASTYGIENVWTVGKSDLSGKDSEFSLHISYGNNAFITQSFSNNVSWTSDSDKVSIDKNGVFKIVDGNFTGIVSFTAKFSYKDVEFSTQAFSVRCVGNAVNVYSYYDLLEATKKEFAVVLQNTIKEDFGYDKDGNIVYEEIETTYDKTFYENIGKTSEAKVKVLLQFKNDVYGNGYQINAHNVAYGLDEADQLKKDAIFRGPLNFVAMSESAGSAVSVKAQDNICFAVYENVTLCNVELRGCDLKADGDGYDLTDLTYTGTTVEVLGDNVRILYSRLTNGRTVLRVFGDSTDASKVIHLDIQNSVLSGAREFILRMGSNCFVDGTKNNPSPYLSSETQTFPAQKAYAAMTAAEKAAYDEKYIKTFVNVKNTVFKDAGIFAIGIDSHFSGGALADGKAYSSILGNLIDTWYDLAKTSYGAKLTFEEEVRMYTWKDLQDIDSSTLIEIVGETQYEGLKFDVKELVAEIAKDENFSNIIQEQNGIQYVHAGIAFFGGGKNYGVFEGMDYAFHDLNGYEVGLDDVGKTELQLAAGNESFYFLLHDRTTGFLPDDQETLLNSGSAYDCIYKK